MSTETPFTDADVARLVALADAATPGPWETDFYEQTSPSTRDEWAVLTERMGDAVCRVRTDEMIEGETHPANDAAFIAAANPATIKALAARLDALHAENLELADLKAAMEHVKSLPEGHTDEWSPREHLGHHVMWAVTDLALQKAEAERDALRDAVWRIADGADNPRVERYDGDSGLVHLIADLRALLSEAGERRG